MAELITHQIKIDEFMTLDWKIPRVITPLELKAMTFKINKLFNIAEVSISSEEESAPEKKSEKNFVTWSPEFTEELKRLYNKGLKPKEIMREMKKFTGDSHFGKKLVIYHRIAYLKKTKELSKRPKSVDGVQRTFYGKKGIYTDDQINDMRELIAKGLSDGFIRDELNQKHGTKFSKTQIASKVWKLKQENKNEGETQNEERTNQAELQEPETTAP